MTWLVGILAAAGAVRLWWWWTTHPVRNELSHPGALARLLRLLLSRGVHKGPVKATLTVCSRADERRRLVFQKEITEAGAVGFRAEFPRAAWAEPYYEPFRAELARRGVPHREVAGRTAPALAFEFGRDVGGAYVVARLLFEEVMGLRLERDCVAYFRDVVIPNAPHLTGVDAPDEGWG